MRKALGNRTAEYMTTMLYFFAGKLTSCAIDPLKTAAHQNKYVSPKSCTLKVKNHKMVKISIITATWNSGKVLGDCILSVHRQSYKNWEHIIVDGGSNDSTLDIIRKNEGFISKLISGPDEGIYDALNKGIECANGDIIGFLHSDDCYSSDNILCLIANAFEDPAVSAVFGDLEYVSKSDISKVIRRWVSQDFQKSDLSWGWMPPHPTLYVRREWYKKIGGFDKAFKISGDYLSILNLFSDPLFVSKHLPIVFLKMRIGGKSNKSLQSILMKSSEDWKAMRRCGMNRYHSFRSLVFKNIRKINQFRF